MLRTTRLLITVATACVAAAVLAPMASADSIAYIKDGNVWLSTPDGSRSFQVTTTGQYADVSQADDGTMIALTGVRLHRLDRMGTVLADFDTPVSDTRDAGARTFFGPFDPAISPDGTKFAYTYYYNTQGTSSTCYPPQCVVAYNEGGTGYSWADRQTSWDDAQLGRHSGWRHPSWIDDDTLVLSNPTHLPNSDVVLDTLSDGSANKGVMVHNWFSDTVEGNKGLAHGDVTRDRKKMAFVTGGADETLTVYAVPNFPTTFKDGMADASTYPSVCYRYSGPNGGKFAVPTWSPDGTKLAMQQGDGIHVADVPSFDGGCTTAGATENPPLVIAGATEPDWGPADVPAGRPAVDKGGQQNDGPANNGGGGGSAGGALGAKAARSSVKAALRKGLKVTVTAPGAGKVGVVVKRGGKTVAKAPARQVAGGKVVMTARFTAAGKRALARTRRAKLAVKVTFAPAGGATQTASFAASLR